MNHRFLVFSIFLYLSSISVYAQVSENDKKIGIPDSVKSDYEEWLRNEPQKSAQHDSSSIDPMQSRLPIISPEKLSPRHPPISVVIMTPKLRTEMQLAYQSHWLEEQRKSQKGGAMTAGINPLSLVAWVVSKIIPHRKSKKQRQREKLQQVLDNY